MPARSILKNYRVELLFCSLTFSESWSLTLLEKQSMACLTALDSTDSLKANIQKQMMPSATRISSCGQKHCFVKDRHNLKTTPPSTAAVRAKAFIKSYIREPKFWKFTCAAHRNQGRHPSPPLTLFLHVGPVSSSAVCLCWPVLVVQRHCLQGG